MTIAVWAPSSDFTNSGQFIVETLLSFTQQHPGIKFLIITDTKSNDIFPGNTEHIVVKPQPENALLKKIWWEVKLPGVLRRIKADYFISFESRCSLAISIPQSILILPAEKIKPSFIKTAKMIFVLGESAKSQLKEKYKVQDKRIAIITPFAGKNFKAANDKEKDQIRSAYSDGKEFFLCTSPFSRKEDLIELLKSFSQFKKRQQSSFNLLLLTEANSFFDKSLSSYKYRSDIKLVGTKKDRAAITATAYAVLVPFDSKDDIFTALNSMQAGVPVIAKKNTVISELAGDAVLYAEEEVKDVGDKLMQLYKDETYRSLLIEKGRSLAATFTPEKTAELLWQSIMKGLQ